MAYFANGSEWEAGTEDCELCVHLPTATDENCPVRRAHWEYNYPACAEGTALHEVFEWLWPSDPESGKPGQCAMFTKRGAE